MRGWSATILRNLSFVERPIGYPHAHASGVDSHRVLLFGSGASVGWGVLSHELALPGNLARALSVETERGVDVDVITDAHLVAANAIPMLAKLQLWKYDAIVITLGLNEAVGLDSLVDWRRDYDTLLDYVARNKAPTCRVFALGVHAITQITRFDALMAPIIHEHRTALNEITTHLCDDRSRATFVPFNPPPFLHKRRYRTTGDYRIAAEILASTMAPQLTPGIGTIASSGGDSVRSPSESDRQRAVDALRIVDTPAESDFDRIVAFAKQAFGTSSAAFTIIDRDRQWEMSRAGTLGLEVSRVDSFCSTTIEECGPLVVADARSDPRFMNSSLVASEPHIRFYAGFPIESPTGERIGALCVFDHRARPADSVDLTLLRDLAIMVQKNLWYRTP
ncbi:MAG: diguanylate cyclase [Glaciihabitans sp.]|nr:diguanylate cyclase [Glaciihabitans sp.]